MKIYFAGSIRGGRQDAQLYKRIIDQLKQYGQVLSEHIGDETIKESGETNLDESDIHDRDMKWIKESDLVVAEVSRPSLGIGYELGRALEQNKKILCLYRRQKGKRLSAMIAGSKEIELKTYNSEEELKKIIDTFFIKL